MTLLKISGISKAFDDTAIIEDTSLSVREGDSIVFMSPSGSGKSTMLSMAGLLLTPDTGQIEVLGGTDALKLDDYGLSRLRRQLFGFVFQSPQLIGSLRAIENVTAPANFMDEKLDFSPEKRAQELLEQLGLAQRMYYYPHQLSVGQKRRLSLARALLLRPKILIADEPTNDLDETSASEVTDVLFSYVEQGNALLYATHIPQLAARAKIIMTLQGKTFVPKRDESTMLFT